MDFNHTEIIAVLGGGLLQDSNGKWHTIDLGQGGDTFATSNDRWRIDATFALWKKNPSLKIIVSGGQGQYKGTNTPEIAKVMEQELIDMGVDQNNIVKELNSNSTREQLEEISKFAHKFDLEEIHIISNEWHIPRAKVILEHFPGLKENFDKVKVLLISAEDILLNFDTEKWSKKIIEARKDPGMIDRVKLEQNGIQKILSGHYKWR